METSFSISHENVPKGAKFYINIITVQKQIPIAIAWKSFKFNSYFISIICSLYFWKI